jgi:hypothetical protein
MTLLRGIGLFAGKLIRDPFLWVGVVYLWGTPRLAATLPTDVLTQRPILQDFCITIGTWMPWVGSTAATYIKFPEVALLLLSFAWSTLPLQIAVFVWLSSFSPILQAEILPYARKYPVRFPVGLFIVMSIAFFLAISAMNAENTAKLTGFRPAAVFSHMPESQAGFGTGIGVVFFFVSLLCCGLLKSIWLVLSARYSNTEHT